MDWLNAQSLQKIKIDNAEGLETFYGKSGQTFNYENFYLWCLKQMRNKASHLLYCKKSSVAKSNRKALEIRESGDNIFWYCENSNKSEDLVKVIKLYNQSIAHGVPNTQENALGYANRSAALFKARRFQESSEDIIRAFECYRLNDSLRVKLLIRLADCFEKLGKQCYTEAKFWLCKLPLGEGDQEYYSEKLKDYQLKKCNVSLEDEETVIPTIERANKKFPSISSAIEVKFSKEFGRHFVATRNIQVGEVLIVEEPYVKSPKQDKLYSHCHHCLRVMWAGIPCEHCVNALYCSRECQTTAWNQYHQYECTHLDLLLTYESKDFEALGARCLFKAVVESGGVQKLKDRIRKLNCSSEPTWPLKSEWYQNGSIESIVSQVTNVEKISLDFLKRIAMYAVRSTFFLACTTDFFGNQYDWNKMTDEHILKLLAKSDQTKFVGGLLVKLFLISLNNSLEFREEEYSPSDIPHLGESSEAVSNKRGNVLVSTLSLINVSCCHNTSKQFKRDQVVLYSACPIKKGEQIFDTHGYHFTEMSRSDRQIEIQQKFHFTCNCIACRGNWAVLQTFDYSFETQLKLNMTSNYSLFLCYEKAVSALTRTKDATFDFQERNVTLNELCEDLQKCYKGLRLPNFLLFCITQTIRRLHRMTGNSSMLRLLRLRNNL